MKELKEIPFEGLTIEQKLGLVTCGGSAHPLARDKEDLEFHLDLIKNHALGAIWVSSSMKENKDYPEMIKIIRDAADYPILIFTDEESGFGNYMIGSPISIGYVNSTDAAYAYGKAIGIESRKIGFNVVCNPLLDRTNINRPCGGVLRSLHPDKLRAAELAAAMAQGMHDAGILTCGKHYPSCGGEPIDSHMAEPLSFLEKEELINDSLFPYKYLNERGLLDSVMPGHKRLMNIDPEYPASMSKPVMDILREIGFEGVAITDALMMMGVVARFGYDEPRWRAIQAGNDLILPFIVDGKASYTSLKNAFERGEISEERLDESVKRVLAMQHNALMGELHPKCTELTPEEEKLARDINKNSIAEICDSGISYSIPQDKNHLFVILTEEDIEIDTVVENDTMSVSWYDPKLIAKKIKEDFPNSDIITLNQFPHPNKIAQACKKQINYDDIVMITFFDNRPYIGTECFTSRIISLIQAWQKTNRISALIHFGNPFLLEEIEHIPRIINGCKSTDCTLYSIDVLAGKLAPLGTIPYKLNIK